MKTFLQNFGIILLLITVSAVVYLLTEGVLRALFGGIGESLQVYLLPFSLGVAYYILTGLEKLWNKLIKRFKT